MTDIVHIDFETRSPVDLKKYGFDRYCANEDTVPTCLAFSFNDEAGVPIIKSNPYKGSRRLVEHPDTASLLDHVAAGGLVYAHNAQFEFGIWNRRCVPLYGWPPLKIEQMRCTMAMALAMSLPGALGDAAAALGLDMKKDDHGQRVMMQLCRPRKTGKPSKTDPGCQTCGGTGVYLNATCPVCVEWYDDPDKYATLYGYCQQDVRTERALHHRLLELDSREQKIWQIDQTINNYGVRIDVPAVKGGMAIVAAEKKRMDAEMRAVTGGHVDTCTSSTALTEWLCAQGAVTAGVAKADVKALLDNDELPGDLWNDELFGNEVLVEGPVRKALKLRQVAAKASTAKMAKMLDTIGPDEIARFLYQYHAAHTGRWGGRRVQPQNMMRPLKVFEDHEMQESIICSLAAGWSAQAIAAFYGQPMDAIASVMRGFLIPHVGNEYVIGDYSNIEGRGLAWLAGDEDKLEAFRRQDDGTGPEIYIVAGAKIFGVDPETLTKKSPERQIGKVSELACIAEDQLVLTDEGLVPIQLVTTAMRVWDGVEFVAHDGVVYKGVKHVLEYDGLIATEDHSVWIQGQRGPVPLAYAASCGLRLAVSGDGGARVRVGQDRQPGETMGTGLAAPYGPDGMHGLREKELDEHEFVDPRYQQGLPVVFAAESYSEKAGSHFDGGKKPLYEPKGPWIPELRGPRRDVRLSKCDGSGTMDSVEHRPEAAGRRTGPNGQLEGIRAGQSSVGHSTTESGEPQEFATTFLESGRMAVCARSGRQAHSGGHDARSDTRGRTQSRSGEAEELARDRRTARVYDLLNCGPRNRFTVSGKLVHNCGFAGGVGAFQSMARIYGVRLADAKAQEIVDAWRNAHPAVAGVQTEYGRKGGYWKNVEQAAMDAIKYPGRKFLAGAPGRETAYLVNGSFLWARLPSGRCLCYPYPEIRTIQTSWGKPREAITYKTALSGDPKARKKLIADPGNTGKWGRISTYGGSLTENNDQAICRDLQADAMAALHDAGLPITMHTHDEIVGEVPIGRGRELLPTFNRMMAAVPAWAKGLPVVVDGGVAHRYHK